jgi:hypothetical protein
VIRLYRWVQPYCDSWELFLEKKQKETIPIIVWWVNPAVVSFEKGAAEIMEELKEGGFDRLFVVVCWNRPRIGHEFTNKGTG